VRDGIARTASDIAREFRHDSGALTRVIDQLERRDLLTRRRSTSDRRVVELALTPKGVRTIEELLPVVVGQMNAALEPFTQAEFEQMRSMMERLVDHLQRQESAPQSPAPGPRNGAARGRPAKRGPARGRSGRP